MADEGQEKEKLQRKKGANLMKNLFKKIGALLVAAIMVLSMCTAVFEDGNANVEIKLKNFDNAEKVEYMLQILLERYAYSEIVGTFILI